MYIVWISYKLMIMAINNFLKMQRVINGLDLTRPIYKYMPLKYVITMLKKQKLYVGKVKNGKIYMKIFF